MEKWVMILSLLVIVPSAFADTEYTQNSITVTIAQDLVWGSTIGYYCNGDVWAVDDGDGLRVSYTDGNYEGVGSDGAMVNPDPEDKCQAFDNSGAAYCGAQNLRDSGLPIVVHAGDSFIMSSSNGANARPAISEAIVLTVVSSTPANIDQNHKSTAFRPNTAGSVKYNFDSSSLRVADLPDLDADTIAGEWSMATANSIVQYPQLDWFGYDSRGMHATANFPEGVYGANIAHAYATVALMMCLDDSDIGDKTDLAIYYTQLGIDLYGSYMNGGSWLANGGHSMGRLTPILIAGWLLNNQDMMGLKDYTGGTANGFHAPKDRENAPPFQEHGDIVAVPQFEVDSGLFPASCLGKPDFDGKLWRDGFVYNSRVTDCGGSSFTQNYKDENGASGPAQILALEFFGQYDNFDHQTYRDWVVDHWLWELITNDIGSYDPWGGGRGYSGASTFVESMWNMYRSACGGDENDGACFSASAPECLNNIQEPGEACDGTDLAGQSCITQGFSGGNLACLSDCSGFDVSSCTSDTHNAHYIREGANGDGSDWANAWNELNQIDWGDVAPGDTIEIAGGTYSTTMNILSSGSPGQEITIKRTENPTYTGQVNINAFIDIPGSHIVLDGVVDNGIKMRIPDTGGWIDGHYIDTSGSYITIRNMEIEGPGYQTSHLARGIQPRSDNILFDNVYIHQFSAVAIRLNGGDRVTIQNSRLHNIKSAGDPTCQAERGLNCHSEHIAVFSGVSNFEIKNSIISQDYDGDLASGFGMSFASLSGGYIRVHDNLFFNVAYPVYVNSDGLGPVSDYVVNGNTFVGYRVPIGRDPTQAVNNIFCNLESHFAQSNTRYAYYGGSHNLYCDDSRYGSNYNSQPDSQVLSPGEHPFIDYMSDWHLASATVAGMVLSQPYDNDYARDTRGEDGVWDRGAYEFTGESTCGNEVCDSGETCSSCDDCTQVHDADDNPCNNIVSLTELIDYIDRWKAGEVSLQDVMGAIVEWKG